jgi:hypothetical protein
MNVHHADGTHECARLQTTLGSVDAKSAGEKASRIRLRRSAAAGCYNLLAGAAVSGERMDASL